MNNQKKAKNHHVSEKRKRRKRRGEGTIIAHVAVLEIHMERTAAV